MDLWIENEISYLPTNESIFLIEEVSIRHDYRLIGKKKSFIDRQCLFLLEIIRGRIKQKQSFLIYLQKMLIN
jgi:hypothetical protein